MRGRSRKERVQGVLTHDESCGFGLLWCDHTLGIEQVWCWHATPSFSRELELGFALLSARGCIKLAEYIVYDTVFQRSYCCSTNEVHLEHSDIGTLIIGVGVCHSM